MRDLDDTDRDVLRLLLDDARRPYSDIADHVGLSPPAVSDRIDRLRDLGVIRGFTVDIDRSTLSEGPSVLVEAAVAPSDAEAFRRAVTALDPVEHVFELADGAVVFRATVDGGDVRGLLESADVLADVESLSVRLLAESEWTPTVGDATLALTCAECDNTVTGEGEVATFDGRTYHFCCSSCLSNFRERYERLSEGA